MLFLIATTIVNMVQTKMQHVTKPFSCALLITVLVSASILVFAVAFVFGGNFRSCLYQKAACLLAFVLVF
jgi:hypothetical protein